MYTSEPLEGVQSPFFAGAQFFPRAEDARRARLELAELAQLEQMLAAAGEAATERLERRVA